MTWYKFFLPIKSLTCEKAKDFMKNNNYELVDVRQKEELIQGKIDGSKLIPLFDLSKNIDKIDKNKTVLIYCRSGSRSKLAVRILRSKGFDKVINISGGILKWNKLSR